MPGTPILIIDDEPGVIEGLREFLEDEGYDVHEALEGKKGLDIFRQVNPDIVVADLRMPGMSGFELIGEIKKIRENVPVVVITGYGTLKSAMDAIRLDVFDFITKPIDLEFLKKTLDRARSTAGAAREIQGEVVLLREQLAQFQTQWQEQFIKFSEVEPLIHAGRLLAGILHDLNNPLTFIMGQAELLQILHPEVENIAVIQEQAIRMRKIMTTIMKKMKESQTRQSEWLHLNDVLREEVFFLESHPYFRGEIEKEWQLDEGLPCFKGVAAEFSQVFGNFLRNAAEAMKGQDKKELVLKTWHDFSGIHISIRDGGPGIPAHLKEKIFKPFFSTKTSEAGMVGGMGMGIGLYHCQELIQRYGGRIEVESGGKEGATFIVHLPILLGELSAEDDMEEEAAPC